MPRIERTTDPTAELRAEIVAPLDDATRRQGRIWAPDPLVLVLRGEAGEVLGGLIGEVHWGWLRVGILAVREEFRGQGWGSRLLAEAERAAVAAGCHGAWVDTFSFQAPEFYLRLGYQVFGELPDYPESETRYFLKKQLPAGA